MHVVDHNANYAWESIIKSKWVIDQGASWRIGKGLNVDIWQDRWIGKPKVIIHIRIASVK